jgi:N-acyl-D-amino-acid deacylase
MQLSNTVPLLIRGGWVVDGTGSPGRKADVGVNGDLLAAVGDLSGTAADRVIDAAGLAVAPGFIDIHSHSDFTILIDPRAEGKVRQGVTTETIGMCGASAAPLAGEKLARVREQNRDLTIDWTDLAGYRRRVERRGSAVNLVPLTGQGNLRGSVIGYGGRGPSRAEMKRMLALLEGELAAGSRGLSTGLVYPPGAFSDFGELAELLHLVEAAAGIYSTHLRNESDRVEEAVAEAIRLAEETGVSLQIAHLKAQGRRNWGRLERCLEMIEASRSRGFPVHCDRYPYVASATDLDILLPAWAIEGGAGDELKRLKDPALRAKLEKEVDRDDWKAVVISRVSGPANRELEGMNLEEAARLRGMKPADLFFRILVEEKLAVEALFFGMDPANLVRILKKPYSMIGSDASARAITGPLARGFPHPRTFGTFPLVLSDFVRDGTLTLEEAVFKMTGLPARKLGLEDRGVIRQGAAADLTIFDPAKVRSRATYRAPFNYPEGIEYVIVNGRIVVERGLHTGNLPGVFLGL